MKNRVIATLLSAGMVLGLAACGTASAKTNDGASDTIVTNETTVSESAATTGDAADSADLGKEDENVSKVLKGSQKAVVVGQDWGPAVTKTILKLDSKVKADSVSRRLPAFHLPLHQVPDGHGVRALHLQIVSEDRLSETLLQIQQKLRHVRI